MAVTLDSATNGGGFSNATSKSFSHTVGTAGKNRAIFAMISLGPDGANPTVPTATYGGVAMTNISSYTVANRIVAAYYLANPLTGSNTVAFSWSNVALGYAGAISFYKVSQSTPYRAGSWTQGAVSVSGSVDVPSNLGDYAVDVIIVSDGFGGSGALTVGAGQTEIYNNDIQNVNRNLCGSSYEAAAQGTTTMSWTENASSTGHMAGFCVVAGSGGGGAAISPTLIF